MVETEKYDELDKVEYIKKVNVNQNRGFRNSDLHKFEFSKRTGPFESLHEDIKSFIKHEIEFQKIRLTEVLLCIKCRFTKDMVIAGHK